jgi:hypothetical protein
MPLSIDLTQESAVIGCRVSGQCCWGVATVKAAQFEADLVHTELHIVRGERALNLH